MIVVTITIGLVACILGFIAYDNHKKAIDANVKFENIKDFADKSGKRILDLEKDKAEIANQLVLSEAKLEVINQSASSRSKTEIANSPQSSNGHAHKNNSKKNFKSRSNKGPNKGPDKKNNTVN